MAFSLDQFTFYFQYLKYSMTYRMHDTKCRFWELRYPNFLDKIQKSDIDPIFILGAGRSGNTLLARLLHETGGVHFAPENYSLWSTYINYLQYIEKPWDERVDRILDVLKGQEDGWRWESLDFESMRSRLLASKEHTLGNIIHVWYEEYGKALDYPSVRWGCKTPNITPFMHIFKKVFPNARLVQIIRQPNEVIASFQKAGIDPYQDPVMAGVHWDYFNRYLTRFNDILIVSYDRLVEEPSTVIDWLCMELGIDTDYGPVKYFNPDMSYPHLSNVMATVGRTSSSSVSVDRFGLSRKYVQYTSSLFH